MDETRAGGAGDRLGRSSIVRIGSAALLLVMVSACGIFGPRPPAQGAGAANATGQSTERNPQYVIGPGDKLNIFVYESPTLSTNGLPVRPDGRISTPLIQDLAAAGKTPSELAGDISEHLRKFVRDPNVTVMVQEFFGPFDRQVRVIGEAAEPQALPYRDHMTVLDVMIATKGLTRFASGNSAVIVRRGANGRQTIKVRLSDLLKDGDIDQNVEMQAGDTLIIPQTFF